jgi:peptidyl-tRNA hydrolase
MAEETVKMYCVVSKAALALMNGVRGKFGTQAGHAYLGAFWDAETRFPDVAKAYRESGLTPKITVPMEDEAALRILEERYRGVCGVHLVTDAGRTVFKVPTVTCLGVGPIRQSDIGDDLALLRPLT